MLVLNKLKILLAGFFVIVALSGSVRGERIVHVPLDERFTTRVAFLNLAKITPFDIVTLPDRFLPSLKKYGSNEQILEWLRGQIPQTQGGIVSIQTLLYGSLIASRISNDTLISIKEQLNKLYQHKMKNPKWKLYGSAVIMRIPEYNADFQEPWFWATHGKLLYTYSYYADKYSKTQDESDQEASQEALRQIPGNILQQFTWRRNRNHQILLTMLELLKQNRTFFQKFYITLDDNAQYGFNVAEADQIRSLVREYGLDDKVLIYPGADEVAFSLLARYGVDFVKKSQPFFSLAFRNQSTRDRIPNYEGIPMQETIFYQIEAAGGLHSSSSRLQNANAINLLMNNFDETKQVQAPDQSSKASPVDYSIFQSFICGSSSIIGLVDNRFSNGADNNFVQYAINKLTSCSRSRSSWAYAGWNTNGNTVGTVVSNVVLLWLFSSPADEKVRALGGEKYCEYCSPCKKNDVNCANSYFNALRILEDRDWQANLRGSTRQYISRVIEDDPNNLATDLSFYQKFAYKPLASSFDHSLKSELHLDFSLSGVYYPWNRTFEIGLYGDLDQQISLQPF